MLAFINTPNSVPTEKMWIKFFAYGNKDIVLMGLDPENYTYRLHVDYMSNALTLGHSSPCLFSFSIVIFIVCFFLDYLVMFHLQIVPIYLRICETCCSWNSLTMFGVPVCYDNMLCNTNVCIFPSLSCELILICRIFRLDSVDLDLIKICLKA